MVRCEQEVSLSQAPPAVHSVGVLFLRGSGENNEKDRVYRLFSG
jgi:hypothetical protein